MVYDKFIQCEHTDSLFICVTEKADGSRYMLKADGLNTVLEDWRNNHNCVPANDAPVYFAMFDGKIINTAEFRTFEALLRYLADCFRINLKTM